MHVALRQKREAALMEKYPGYKTYQALYARYHDKGVADLLRLLEPLEDMSVADLCAGDGRLTFMMLASGVQSVFFVDAESEMVPPSLGEHKQVQVMISEVHFALDEAILRGNFFDRIVCQQAINYWLDEESAQSVARALKSSGIFAFNTFNQQPSLKPRVLQYELGGHSFVEVSWLVGDEVHHLQARDGLEPHHTVFRWLSPERLRELLEPYFAISEKRHEKTSLYRCEKK
jgi:SAM-dependent methyltransferase